MTKTRRGRPRGHYYYNGYGYICTFRSKVAPDERRIAFACRACGRELPVQWEERTGEPPSGARRIMALSSQALRIAKPSAPLIPDSRVTAYVDPTLVDLDPREILRGRQR